MRALSLLALSAALAALAACGQEAADAPTGSATSAPVVEGPAPDVSRDTEADAEALFAGLCAEQGIEDSVCVCVRERVVTASGMRGLGYIGAAFREDPEAAAPYEAAMTQDARDIAAEAYLDGHYQCIAGDDPAFIPPIAPPGDSVLAESPLEQAVAACLEYGVGDEPLCRCRAEAVFDTLGESGLALAEADARGDPEAVQALAGTHGAQWLNDGLGAMAGARTQCAL